jgi:hypothetical protein
MPEQNKKRLPSLEREAITAIVVLYLLITVGVLAIHYWPFEEFEGRPSTSSPHHQESQP